MLDSIFTITYHLIPRGTVGASALNDINDEDFDVVQALNIEYEISYEIEAKVMYRICFLKSIPDEFYDMEAPLTDKAMKELMILSSKKMTEFLMMRQTLSDEYFNTYSFILTSIAYYYGYIS